MPLIFFPHVLEDCAGMVYGLIVQRMMHLSPSVVGEGRAEGQ